MVVQYCMKKLLVILFLLIPICSLSSQTSDTLISKYSKAFPTWTLIIPGGSYLYNGRISEGLTFAAFEISGVVIGLKYNSTLKNNSTSPYYNYPAVVALKIFEVDKCDFLRNRLELIKLKAPDFKYDQISESDLLLAPFKSENIFTPITIGFVGAALIELLVTGRRIEQKINKVEQIYFLDHYIKRNPALTIYGTTSLSLSWGAGVSEEYLFRNTIMPILDYKYGQTKGLLYSSISFGIGHFTNLAFSNKPDFGQSLLQVFEATIGGYLLGRDVQNRGYQIGPAVAAHTWYNFTLILGSFLINPKENVFAVNVKFTVK